MQKMILLQSKTMKGIRYLFKKHAHYIWGIKGVIKNTHKSIATILHFPKQKSSFCEAVNLLQKNNFNYK